MIWLQTDRPARTACIRLWLALLLLCGVGDAALAQQSDDLALRKGKLFIGELSRGRFDAAASMVAPAKRETLSIEQLQSAWRSLLRRHGDLKQIGRALEENRGVHRLIYVELAFESRTLEARVVFDSGGQVVGLFFELPRDRKLLYSPPSYVDTASFLEQEYQVVNEDYRLPGTLTLPKRRPPHSVVLLLAGSGPNDRDETIGPNKPLRDVAWGLATRGIASLRYDKRTLSYRARMDIRRLTYREEIVDDAVAAIRQLRRDDRFDRQSIFALGHGLGGQLVPAIAQRARPLAGSPYLAGGIVMAGSARPMAEVMIDHLNHIANEDGVFTLEERGAVLAFQSGIEAMLESGDPDYPPVMGIGYRYLSALNDYDCLKTASRLKIPLFIAQGGRDSQVTEAHDFSAWRDALSSRSDVVFALYPSLNHLFIAGTHVSYPSEYDQPGHVDRQFIEDLSAWILSSN